MEDERLSLGDPAGAPDAMRGGALGVDVVRIHAQWWRIAPRRRPLRAGDPGDPRYWSVLDRAVGAARAAGMKVMLTSGPGPLWTTAPGPPRRALEALAERVRALRPRRRGALPRRCGPLSVERAGPAGLAAAAERVHGPARVARRSPAHLPWPRARRDAGDPRGRPRRRGAAGRAFRAGRQPGAQRNTPIAPLPFLRAFACVDRAYAPLRQSSPASARPRRTRSAITRTRS
jgi:hypothetical protein